MTGNNVYINGFNESDIPKCYNKGCGGKYVLPMFITKHYIVN